MLEEAKRKFFVFLSWSYYVLKAEKMDRKKILKKNHRMFLQGYILYIKQSKHSAKLFYLNYNKTMCWSFYMS